MSWRWWPGSLFGRLLGVLFVGLLVALGLSAWIHWSERERVMQRAAGLQPVQRVADIVRLLDPLEPAERARIAGVLDTPQQRLSLDDPPAPADRAEPGAAQRLFTAMLQAELGDEFPLRVRAREGARLVRGHGDPEHHARMMARRAAAGLPVPPEGPPLAGQFFLTQVQLHDGTWVSFDTPLARSAAGWPLRLLASLAVLLLAVAGLSWWAVRRVSAPLRELAVAADALGRDLHRAPLPEDGPDEVRQAAQAFNTMQQRLRRFIDDRTQVLAAMSHDLKTPLTRLRLRAELLEDEALRERFERDLREMEAMVTEALAALRGLDEPARPVAVDVDALLQALVADQVEMGRDVQLAGRAGAPLQADPAQLRRCLGNLVDNAVLYGQRARLQVTDEGTQLRIQVRDEGPGIPPAQLERVFDPFHRVEASRNRATGGTGLGLGIARHLARRAGGDITLRNPPEGGLEATLSLPR